MSLDVDQFGLCPHTKVQRLAALASGPVRVVDQCVFLIQMACKSALRILIYPMT